MRDNEDFDNSFNYVELAPEEKEYKIPCDQLEWKHISDNEVDECVFLGKQILGLNSDGEVITEFKPPEMFFVEFDEFDLEIPFLLIYI